MIVSIAFYDENYNLLAEKLLDRYIDFKIGDKIDFDSDSFLPQEKIQKIYKGFNDGNCFGYVTERHWFFEKNQWNLGICVMENNI